MLTYGVPANVAVADADAVGLDDGLRVGDGVDVGPQAARASVIANSAGTFSFIDTQTLTGQR